MLFLFRILASGGTLDLPKALAKGRKTEEFCTKIHTKLADVDAAVSIFQRAGEIIELALQQSPGVTAADKSREVTERMVRLTATDQATISLQKIATVAVVSRQRGTVKWFRGSYGFITDESGNDFFVHFKTIRGPGFRELSEGQFVKFTPKKWEKGLIAQDVEVI